MDKRVILGDYIEKKPLHLLATLVKNFQYSLQMDTVNSTRYKSKLEYLNKLLSKLKYNCSEICIYRDRSRQEVAEVQIPPQPQYIFDDWFLPSLGELSLMRENLYAEGVGDFKDYYYASSTESSETNFMGNYFPTGLATSGSKQIIVFPVRPIRTFTTTETTYSLRDVGPSGGLIFHIDGTTYYEACAFDLPVHPLWSNVLDQYLGTTSSSVGEGLNNSVKITQQAGNYMSMAQACLDLSIDIRQPYVPTYNDWYLPNKSELESLISKGYNSFTEAIWTSNEAPEPTYTYEKWFLPSIGELQKIHKEIYSYGLGNFSDNTSVYYMSSSEWVEQSPIVDAAFFYGVIFNGYNSGIFVAKALHKSSTPKVRPIITFKQEVGQYSLRDVGPNGGYIFYIDGTTHYEVASEDLEYTVPFSNVFNALAGTGPALGDGIANTIAIIAQDALDTTFESAAYFVDKHPVLTPTLNHAMTILEGIPNTVKGYTKDSTFKMQPIRYFLSTEEFAVGDTGKAGIVFDSTSIVGPFKMYFETLPITPSEISAKIWGDTEETLSLYDSVLGEGKVNTVRIHNHNLSKGIEDTAAEYCLNFEIIG
ncbi:MAG TPA: hypothetical protein GX519_06020 [Thermoanaerobacterales bacterium]|nr:hypothetical protein [Thermoanaerobacterales bacterium]